VKKIAKEKDNNTVLSWYFQKSESNHYREIKYKSGKVVTTDLSGKDE
jgi:hypothetical protein